MSNCTVISAPGDNCWTQIRSRRGWMVCIYRVMAYWRCLGKWIHVLFCSHWVQWDCLQIPRVVIIHSRSWIGIWHKTWYTSVRLNTNAVRSIRSLLIFLDLGLVGEKNKTGLQSTEFVIHVPVFLSKTSPFLGTQKWQRFAPHPVQQCFFLIIASRKGLVLCLSHRVLFLPWNWWQNFPSTRDVETTMKSKTPDEMWRCETSP